MQQCISDKGCHPTGRGCEIVDWPRMIQVGPQVERLQTTLSFPVWLRTTALVLLDSFRALK